MNSKSASNDTNVLLKCLPTFSCTTDIRSDLINKCDDDVAQQIIPLDAIGNFFVLMKSGKIRKIDERADGFNFTFADYKKHVKLAYNQFFGSIIALDEQLVCARREYNGQYTLANMLTRMVDFENFPVEFATGEDMIWRCFLSSQDLQRAPEMRKLLNELNQSSNGMRKSDFIATVINLNIMQMFIELNVLIAADRKRPPINNDFSSFFYAHLLLERLRLLLRPLKPYSPFDSNITGKFRTESVGDLMHVVSFISKDVMNVEAARRLSFYRWPHNNFKHTTSSRMAEAGFYFQPNDGGDDKVICFACSVCLVSWEPDDDPYQEHQRHSPHCKLLTAPLGSINIPFAATMSSLAPLRWNDNIESQHLIINNVDNLIIGMMTSKTSWFAFSDPSSIKPQITLLHLDKVTQAVNSLLIDIFDPFLSNAIGLNLQNITAPVQTLPPIETLNNVIVATQQRRVTWSDEPNEITIEQQQQPPIERIVVLDPNIAEEAFDDDRDEDMVSPGFIEEQEYEEFKQHQPTPHVSISPNHFNKQTVKITSICSASIGNDNEINADDQNSTQQPCVNSSNMDCSADSRSTKISAILFIGITVDEITTNSNKRKEELNTINVMNPFSVDHNQIISGKRVENVHCPFLLVYHLTETLIPHVDIKSDELKEKEEPMEQSFNKNEERDKDDFSIESTLLAETKKLQEQTAAFSAELVEFLSSEYPNKKPSLLAKYINNNPQDKTSGNISSAEKIDNTNQVDSTYFDAPLQQSLNPETKVSILYEQKDISTIVMQCFRLPDELNSSHFRIDHIVATENSNGHVVLGVNRITDCVADFSSSIVVYSRMSVVHMLQEICSHKFFFPNVKIAQILLLSIDYFVLYRMQKLNEQKECTHRQTSNKEVKQQLIGSAVLRFTNGQVVLLDLNSGFSVPIFDPKNFEDFQTCADIFLTSSEENTDQIIILTTKGRILCFDVKIPILPSSCVERDEKTFSEFSKALSVASTRSPIGEFHLQKELPEALTYGLLAADDKTFSSLDAFDKLWALTRLHSASTSTQSSSDVNSPCPSSEPSNWNSLLANEIQVHAPTNWVDTTSHRRFRRPITSTLPNLSSSIYLPDNEFESKQKPLGVSHNTRTTWTFSRVDEAIFPAAVANIADQNLVFEFSMPPIIPISHIEISLSSNSQSTSKLPIGGQLSIWLLNNETIERLSTKFKSVSGSFSALHNKQMLLSLLAEKPEIFVEEKAKCVYGPQSLEQLVSCNLKNNTDVFRIRINTCALLLGAADFIDKLQTGWINQPLHFFIHYKPPVSGVNECLNAYKTSTGKSLFLRQQQQTRLLECFGIHRGLASSSDQLITPSTVGSPLKRSYPGCSADSNENGSKSSPPFYYPASSVISSNTGYTPTLFSLCIYFCSTQELS